MEFASGALVSKATTADCCAQAAGFGPDVAAAD